MSNSNIPQTPEAIAYQLMNDLFVTRKTTLTEVTTEDLIATFAQCLELVRNPNNFLLKEEKNHQTYQTDRPRKF